MKRLVKIFKKLIFSTFARTGRLYRLKVLLAILIASIAISNCSNENVFKILEDYNAGGEDTLEYLNILSVYPGISTSNIAVNSDFRVKFDNIIDMSSVTASSFNISPGPLAGSFTYDSELNTVIFNPTADFATATLYNVTLTTGIKSLVDESMSSDFTWSFTTAAAFVPEISILSPLIEVNSGDAYDYGGVNNLGLKSAVFTINNNGSGNLNITSITLSGPDCGAYNISVNPAPITRVPGANTSFTVDFTPSTVGIKNAVVTVASDDSDESLFLINLTGTSLVASSPEIQITKGGIILVSGSSTINFGSIHHGGSSTLNFVMYNIGSADLVITGSVIGGDEASFFTTNFVPCTITPGLTAAFSITFSPPVKKNNAVANITFQNNDSDESAFKINVKGKSK